MSAAEYEKWDSLVFGLEKGFHALHGSRIYQQQQNLKW